jgi:chitin disaccharide deacetylase
MKRLIVNADDLGYTAGVNRGIVEAHERGIVTSTSMMVDRPASAEGAEIARATPSLSVIGWRDDS